MVCCSVVYMPTRNFGPGTSFPENFGPRTSFPWNFGPGTSFPWNFGPGTSFPWKFGPEDQFSMEFFVPGPIFHGILVLGTNLSWTIGPGPKIHGEGTKNPWKSWSWEPIFHGILVLGGWDQILVLGTNFLRDQFPVTGFHQFLETPLGAE